MTELTKSGKFELTRSIIYKCPALKMPQDFLSKLGNVAQLVVLKGANDETAKFIVDACNSAQSTPSAESTPQIASPEGWHAPGMGEVHNEQHTKMIFCSDGEDLASDSLANEVCSALLQSPATPPSESDRELWQVAMDAYGETSSKIESIRDAWQRVADRVVAAREATGGQP